MKNSDLNEKNKSIKILIRMHKKIKTDKKHI